MATITDTDQPQNLLLASQKQQSAAEYLLGYLRRVRGGDLGALPIVLGLIVISVIFQGLNPNFLTPRNFVNLILQMAGITTIAYGLVYILLLGEIDLSVGYVSAVAGVGVAMIMRGQNLQWFASLGVIVLALAMTSAIGFLHGLLITTFQLPSFVVTLAGLLAWNGVVLLLVGAGGTVIIQDPIVIGIANTFLSDEVGWIAGILIVLAFAYNEFRQLQTRRRQGLPTKPMPIVVAMIVGTAVVVFLVVTVANQDRGVPVVGLLLVGLLVLLTFVAEKTRFGRYVYAIGGNREAARRAGIRVERIRVMVFMLSSLMAGFGGLILASRLRSVDTNAGGGDLLLNSIAAAVIGGTSLFGGSGKVSSAVLGALIIASIANGMGLLGLSSGIKFVITGLVLLVAVIVDAVSRRNQKQSGLR